MRRGEGLLVELPTCGEWVGVGVACLLVDVDGRHEGAVLCGTLYMSHVHLTRCCDTPTP